MTSKWWKADGIKKRAPEEPVPANSCNVSDSAPAPLPALRLPDIEPAPAAEQPDQADNNQIYCDDIVQQTRHQQNENAGDQRNQRGEA